MLPLRCNMLVEPHPLMSCARRCWWRPTCGVSSADAPSALPGSYPVEANCFGLLSSLKTPRGINLETNVGRGLHRHSLQVRLEVQRMCLVGFLLEDEQNKKCLKCILFFFVFLRHLAPLVYRHNVSLKPFLNCLCCFHLLE